MKMPFLVSICVGLFLAQNLYLLFLVYLSPEYKWVSIWHQIGEYVETTLLFFTIGFCVSVFFSLVIGWPLYQVAKRHSAVNYITCSLGGIAVTTIPYFLCLMLGWNVPGVIEKSGAIVFSVLIFCGACGGIVFNRLESGVTLGSKR